MPQDGRSELVNRDHRAVDDRRVDPVVAHIGGDGQGLAVAVNDPDTAGPG